MKNVLKTFFVLCFSVGIMTQAYAGEKSTWDDIKINVLAMQRFTSDFETRQTSLGFDLSGVRLQKDFRKDFTAVLFAYFASPTVFVQEASVNNNALMWGVYEAYIKFHDIGYGISIWRFGQGETAWYQKVIKNYYKYRYVMKPLSYRLYAHMVDDLGIYLNKNFLDNAIQIYAGYHTGEGLFGAGADSDNAGAVSITTSFFPMKNAGSGLKDLSINFTVNAKTREENTSVYSVLLGYKYLKNVMFTAAYLGTYSRNRANLVRAASVFADVLVLDPVYVLARYDYVDRNGQGEHLILGGVSSKFFDGKFGVALTFDATKPAYSNSDVTSKRLSISTYYYF